MRPAQGAAGPTLDVQVLEVLETYIATEQFLHKLEAASAEWIDLSQHQHAAPPTGWPHQPAGDDSICATPEQQQGVNKDDAAAAPAPAPSHTQQAGTSSEQQQQQPPGAQRSSSSTSSSSGSFLTRWLRPASNSGTSTATAAGAASNSQELAVLSPPPPATGSSSSADTADGAAGLPPTASCFEVVGPQPHLAESLMHEPFVLVSSDDAVEAMAYYIALYLSRAPEARNMEPKQLQAALKQTFTAIRRSRYRAIWDWGRWMYRCTAVSYSALQLYEHPWVVRAVVAGVWASSRMALGFLW